MNSARMLASGLYSVLVSTGLRNVVLGGGIEFLGEPFMREIRTRGFKNEVFNTLEDVIDRLCYTISSLSIDIIKSITGREWILSSL